MKRIRIATVLGVTVLVLLALASAPASAADVTLTVSVENSDGDAVGGATLTATWENGSATATTASNGKAFLDVPEGETVDIAVSHDRYMRNSPVTVEDAAERDVTMTVHRKGEATINVRDQDGAVNDARVTLRQQGRIVFSQATTAGSVETGDVEAGTYDLEVRKPGYYEVNQEISIPANDSVERDVDLERGSVTLQVNVTDPYFEPPRPLGDISVTVEGQGTVNTQSDGRQQLSVPVNTKLTVRFEDGAYEQTEQSVKIEESDTTLQVSLERANSLSVSVLTDRVVVGQPAFLAVVDEYEDPVANATVRLNGEEVAETDADGEARVLIESVGTHEIQVDDGEVTSNVTEVTAIEESETVIATPTTEATNETTAGTTESETPGFGPIVAIVGVLAALVIAVAGRRSA